jgi:putative phosphoribosyl transferase
MSVFRDRADAGRLLADLLLHAAKLGGDGVVVLGLPRGGVPVAAEVARALGAPLDAIMVRKLGVPSEPELALGALGEDGVLVENERVMGSTDLGASDVKEIARREEVELMRRARLYREGRPRLDLSGLCAVIVDDGIATGSTARAACRVARAHGAVCVVLAVPVAPLSGSTPWANGTTTSCRLPTPRWWSCFALLVVAEGDRVRGASRRRDHHLGRG